MPSMFKPSTSEKRPVATLLVGLFTISQVYQLSSLAITNGLMHPKYLISKAVFIIIGILIWLDGLKSGNFASTVLKYIAFWILASVFQFFMYVSSYSEPVKSMSEDSWF